MLLAGCSGSGNAPASRGTQDLESAAIERGLIRDPEDRALTGLYARDSDRICIVGDRIGVTVDYGDGGACSATGQVTRRGETLRITLGPRRDCVLDARFDGDHLLLPGAVPAACRTYCTRRASLAGTEVEQLSQSASEAAALRDGAGRLLCAR